MELPRGQHSSTATSVCEMASTLLLMTWVKAQDLGRVVTNDAGILTRRDPGYASRG